MQFYLELGIGLICTILVTEFFYTMIRRQRREAPAKHGTVPFRGGVIHRRPD